MNRAPYAVVGYLARDHGLNGLESLLASDRYEVACLFTHQRRPKSEDPQRSQRPEFQQYQAICQQHDIPLVPVDTRQEAGKIGETLQGIRVDLNASISWRFLIPQQHLALARCGGVNLHRGKLPQYAGAEPIKRMLLDEVADACISAHVLEQEIDTGPLLKEVTCPVQYDERLTLDEQVEQVKRRLTSYFGPLLIEALDKMVERYEQQHG